MWRLVNPGWKMLSSSEQHRLRTREKVTSTFPLRKGAESCFVFFLPSLWFSPPPNHPETSLTSVCPIFVLPSLPNTSQMPTCLSICHKKPVRYCGCVELCLHVAVETHWLELFTCVTPAVTWSMRDTLASVFSACLPKCVCVCVLLMNRRELLLKPLDFLPRAAPRPPCLTSSAPQTVAPRTHDKGCSPDQAR